MKFLLCLFLSLQAIRRLLKHLCDSLLIACFKHTQRTDTTIGPPTPNNIKLCHPVIACDTRNHLEDCINASIWIFVLYNWTNNYRIKSHKNSQPKIIYSWIISWKTKDWVTGKSQKKTRLNSGAPEGKAIRVPHCYIPICSRELWMKQNIF